MTEWFYPGNPNKYRVIPAFRDLKKVDWRQSSSPAINDIVYIYVSGDVQQIKLKSRVSQKFFLSEFASCLGLYISKYL